MSFGHTLRKSMSASKAALGVVALTMVTAGGVSPGDLASNVSEWAALFGVHDLPPWLTFPGTDQWAVWIGALLFMVFVGWTGISAWRNAHPDRPAVSPLPADTSLVLSINQSGGQTAHTIVNQAPKPELKQIETKRVPNADGTYSTTAILEVVSPYPPASLKLTAVAPSILDFEAKLDRVGMQMKGWSGKRDGYCFDTIMSPSGRVVTTVKTAKDEPINIEYGFS